MNLMNCVLLLRLFEPSNRYCDSKKGHSLVRLWHSTKHSIFYLIFPPLTIFKRHPERKRRLLILTDIN